MSVARKSDGEANGPAFRTEMSSPTDPWLSGLRPFFNPDGSHSENEENKDIIEALSLQPHPEGGYFIETDRDPLRIPNPFASQPKAKESLADSRVESRSASTTIYYYLTPERPLGYFHRNKARTVHTLHRGRGRYVIIHADEVATTGCPGGYGDEKPEEMRWTGKARVETFVVGHDVLNGERLQ
ncbi:hypothetical protein LTR37_015716 [Vermiconidia calcicola]|uniref:Uncharacterized protein n=1 Tax=Vermiconidia calcicola TaxID=1690605 RepID=A0ACC3MQ12_9PEZI|nr:hypothetical protein LTR37_015716 [Vermiconidia calcicola]